MMFRLTFIIAIMSINVGCAHLKSVLNWGDPTRSEFVMDAPKVIPDRGPSNTKSKHLKAMSGQAMENRK